MLFCHIETIYTLCALECEFKFSCVCMFACKCERACVCAFVFLSLCMCACNLRGPTLSLNESEFSWLKKEPWDVEVGAEK